MAAASLRLDTDGLTVGSNDYVRKPVNQEELMARVKCHLDVRETIEETTQVASSNRMLSELLPMTLVKQIQRDGCEL
eukprot:1105435-Prorocentrum_minimum.AAC.1